MGDKTPNQQDEQHVNEASDIVTQLAEAEAEEDLGRESEDFFAVNIPALLEALANLPALPEGVTQEDLAVFGLSGWLGRRELRIATKIEHLEQSLEKAKTKNHKTAKAIELLETEVDFLETKLEAAKTDHEKLKLEVDRAKFETVKEKDRLERASVDAGERDIANKKLDEAEYALSLEKGTVVRLQLNIKALQEELKNYKDAVDYPGELDKARNELQELHAEHERVKIQLREQMQRTDEVHAQLITTDSNDRELVIKLESENRQLLDQNNLLAGQLQTYKDQLFSLEVAQDGGTSQISRATVVAGEDRRMPQAEEEARVTREREARLAEETRLAQAREARMAQEMKEMEQIRADLQQQVQALKSELNDKSQPPTARKDSSANETMVRQLSQLNDDRSNLLTRIEELKDEVDKLSRENTTMTEAMENVNQECLRLTEKVETFTIDTHALHEQHQVLETIIKNKETEISKLLEQVEKLKIELAALRDQLDRTSDDLKQCRDDTDRLTREKQAVQRQQSQVDAQQLREDAEQARQELDKAKDHLTKLESKLKMVEAENAQLEQTAAAEIEYLRETNKQLSHKIADLETMVTENEDGESTKDQLPNEIHNAQLLVSDQAAKIEHLELQVADLRKQRSALREEKTDLEERLEELADHLSKSPVVLDAASNRTSPKMSPVPQESPVQALLEPHLPRVPPSFTSKPASHSLNSFAESAENVMKETGGKLPPVDKELSDGWNVWHLALYTKQINLMYRLPVELLPRRTHALGWTPLHMAVAMNDMDIMTKFFNAVQVVEATSLWSPLSQLIETRDHSGQTAFHLSLTLQSKVSFKCLLQLFSSIPSNADPLQMIARTRAILMSVLDCGANIFEDSGSSQSVRELVSCVAPLIHKTGLFPPMEQRLMQRSQNLIDIIPGLVHDTEMDNSIKFAPTVQLNSDDMELAEELMAASRSIRKAISDDKDEIRLSCPGDQLKISRRPVLHQLLKEYPEPEMAAKAMYSGLCYLFEFGSCVTRSLSLCVILAGRLMVWEFVQASPDGQISRLESSKGLPMDAVLKLRKEDCREFKLADLSGMTMFSNIECFILFDVAGKGQILIESPDRLMLHKYLVMNFRLATSLRVYHPEMPHDLQWGLQGERLNLTVTELPVALPIKNATGSVVGSLLTLKHPTKIREAECLALPNAVGTCLTHVATRAAVYRAGLIRVHVDPHVPLEDIKVTPDIREMFCLLFTSGEITIYEYPTKTRIHSNFRVSADSNVQGFNRTLPPPPGGQPNKVFGAFKDFFTRALSSTLIEPGIYGVDLTTSEQKQVVLLFDESDQRDDWLRALTFTALAQPLSL